MEDYLYKKALETGITLNNDEISKFLKYKDLLISWNKSVNLTAITDEREIIVKHFIDSLFLTRFIDNNASVIDIGTGAGFPGIPIKIVKENISLTLLDSQKKRHMFLKEVITNLELTGCTCINKRAEEAGRESLYRESFDISVSRAVAELSVLCEFCLPFVKPGGFFLAMKGTNVNNEIAAAKNAIKVLGGEILEVKETYLEENTHFRAIIIIKKINNTPDKFPRRTGKPSKNPL